MKILSIEIENFRGIKLAKFDDLEDVVVVAGQNGSGKSCVFDAIRLLKSIYGGYQANEWHQWMSEFNIKVNNNGADVSPLFYDKSKPIKITCEFELHSSERAYLDNSAEHLVTVAAWRAVSPEMRNVDSHNMALMASHQRMHQAQVQQIVANELPVLKDELKKEKLSAGIIIEHNSSAQVTQCKSLEIIFSQYQPGVLGLIDYHGPQRFFQREIISGINLNLQEQKQQQSQHTLYNSMNKYGNVKSEMAASYIKEVLREKAGIPIQSQNSLSNTLKEMFKTFFPDKEFLGPRPTSDGSLDFTVRTSDGTEHDLNDLSAGEKEILYGYLRIRNSAPCFSIILLDEPEIHLNPRLVRSLPRFYKKYLGQALDNQLWLVSHSDALLREIVGSSEFSLYHMQPATTTPDGMHQAKPLTAQKDIEALLLDLIGDLAAYRPGGKVVVFEGGGNSEFDVNFVNQLFPEFASKVNGIAGGSKSKVRQLHEVLDKSGSDLPFKVYSIVDKDSDNAIPTESKNKFSWDVYHIENYLLSPTHILKAMNDIGCSTCTTEENVTSSLRKCARELLPDLIKRDLTQFANDTLVKSINLRTKEISISVSESLFEAVENSVTSLNQQFTDKLSKSNLAELESSIRSSLEDKLNSNEWMIAFPGRDILRRFIKRQNIQISYKPFVNLIISRMINEDYKPTGMKSVIDAILEDKA